MKNFYNKMVAMAILLLALVGPSSGIFAQVNANRPDWRKLHYTSEEEFIQSQQYQGNRSFTETNPPTGNVRFPAEFEKMQAVMVSYNKSGTSWRFAIPTQTVVSMSQDVNVVVLVPNSTGSNRASILLEDSGANMDNVSFQIMSLDSYWVRDYGPWFMFAGTTPGIVDFPYNRPQRPNDDNVPVNAANNMHLALYGMNLMHTGGNMMQDGKGGAVSTELILEENQSMTQAQICTKMQDYLGINNYMIVNDPQGEYIKHTDCFSKFLAPDKIMVARVPSNDPQYQAYEEVASYFANTNCCYGYPYKVYRVDELGSSDNAGLSPYTNSLILNNKVYVPLGNNATYNANAIAAYEAAMPGYTVIGVSSPNSTPWLNTDALHCRTRGVMDFDMLYVDHRNVIYGEEVEYQNAYAINADITAYSGAAVTEANLVYRVNDGEWQTVSMTTTTGNTYTANITGATYLDEVDYYITATDANGNAGSQPIMGALDPHSFTIAENPLGTLEFSAESTNVPFNTTVRFSYDGDLQNLASLVWVFEGADIDSSYSMNPYVSYPEPGTYDVTLTATLEDGQTLTLVKEDYITVTNHILMHTGSVVYAFDAVFCDGGDADGDYQASQNQVLTIYPHAGEHVFVKANFTSFDLEYDYDRLTIYDGPRVASNTIIGTYSGNELIGEEIIATNPEGALTFKFVSNYVNNKSGWTADITCVQDDYYTITCDENVENGIITVADNTVYAGDIINVIAIPDDNYQLDRLYYVGDDLEEIDIDLYSNSFVMPASDIVIYGSFVSMGEQTTVIMTNGSCATGNSLFYDSGNATGNYSANENYVYTFYPNVEVGAIIRVDFNSFNTESRYDVLYVYDGTNTDAPLIGSFSGTRCPDPLVATNDAGALTFRFASDRSVNRAGWEALVSTVSYKEYYINIGNTNNGTITANYEVALAGTVVTLGADPVEGYFFTGWTVVDDYGNVVEVVGNQFVMPEADVYISGNFVPGHYTPAHYELVTDIYDLEPGTRCLIVNSGNEGLAAAMGEQKASATGSGFNYYFKYYRDPVAVTIEVDEYDYKVINNYEGATEFVIEEHNGYVNFYDPEYDGYLYCSRTLQSNNRYEYYLNTVKNTEQKDWQVTMQPNDGSCEILNVAYYRDMGFSQSRFDVYTLGNAKRLYIFKKVEGFWSQDDRNATTVSEQESNVSLYPNPTSDNVTVNASGMSHISVFTLAGQMVYDMDVNADQQVLNMSQFGAGLFIVRIVSEEGVSVQRVSVTR